MPATSLRDRFWTKPVARALTSPSAILATGAGAAVGVVAASPLGLLVVAGGAIGAAVGLGGRLALAIPRKPQPVERGIDPFRVQEPWRHAVVDALQAKGRFTQALGTFRDGPIKATMARTAEQVDVAVSRCWQVAQQGDLIASARSRLGDRSARTELARLRDQVGDGEPSDLQAKTIRSLESQIATADRLDELLVTTTQELDLLNARLDESVTRAVELSVSNELSGAADLGADLDEIVTDLEALRLAIEDVDTATDGPATDPAAGGETAGSGA